MNFLGIALDIPKLPDEVQDNLEKIDESAKYLLSLINDTLDMNKIESNKIQLNLEPTDLKAFFGKMIDVVEVSAKQKKVQLVTQCSQAQIPLVNLDRVRVQQILFNIMSNAIKFTPENGVVEVCNHSTVTADSRVHTVVKIKDTGIGISKEFLPKIFEPFEQENGASTSNYTGTGLGLAIVKNLVDIMGGTVAVTSEKEKGTEFVVELDFDISQSQETADAPKLNTMNTLSGKRVLLCEDHPLNARIA